MDLHARTDRLAQLLEDRLDIRGSGFAIKVKRAGRLLPRHLRQESQHLAEALALIDNPKTAHHVDLPRLERAADQLERHLLNIDPWERRKGLAVNFSAGLAFNLLAVAVLLVAFLMWRGLI